MRRVLMFVALVAALVAACTTCFDSAQPGCDEEPKGLPRWLDAGVSFYDGPRG